MLYIFLMGPWFMRLKANSNPLILCIALFKRLSGGGRDEK
jgi:hypothetical protein